MDLLAHNIKNTFVPEKLRREFFFHATWLFSDHKAFKGLLPAEQRFAILRELLNLIAKLELPVS